MSEDSLLGGLSDYDLENALDDPFDLKDGVYHGHVTAFKKVEGSRDDGSNYSGLSVTLTPIDGVPYNHYLSFPNENDKANVVEIKKSKIKSFFVGCGVPASRLNTVTAEDVVGTPITFAKSTSKPNASGKRYSNVDVKPRNEDDDAELDMESIRANKGKDNDMLTSDFDL